MKNTLFAALVISFIGIVNSGCEKTNILKIGAVLPLTGDIASYGQAARKGIDLAVMEINANAGAQGRQFRIIYEDNQGKATESVTAMQKLISIDGVSVVMGAAASSNTLALAPIANREQVVLISPISSSKSLTDEGGPFFFRVCPSDVVQAQMMAEWFVENGHQRAAVIYVNNSWGQGLKDEFVSRFEAAGGEVVTAEGIQEGDRDIRTPLTRSKAEKPDALYAITYGREGGALLRQAVELNFGSPIYGADVWSSPELAETAMEAASGVGIIAPASFEDERYERFAQAFTGKYGEAPDIYATYAYDMTMIVIQALQKGPTGSEVRDFLLGMTYEGASGLTRFDENGDVVGKGFARVVL